MKIDKSTTAVTQIQPESKVGSLATKCQPGTAETTSSAVTHLAQIPDNAGPDIDSARVNELRQSILDGRLVMNTDQVAESLIASVREMLEQNGS